MKNFTPVGKYRFNYFLTKIEEILTEASNTKDPARFIYSKDMRTPLFMLEALARIYEKIYGDKKLKKLNKRYKYLEDFIGQIDFYDGFHNEFMEDGKIPELVTVYAKSQTEKKIKNLNKHLKKEKWIGIHKKRLKKSHEKLDSIEWLDEKRDTIEVLKVYQDEIKKIVKKYKNPKKEFTNIETDVHELRRELRWLSIYPQALLGLMQLKPGGEVEDFLKKYLTPSIINSSYNIMPDGSNLEKHILLNQNYYYALSWMIAELGKLKDKGLKIKLLEESISEVYKAKENVTKLAYSFCNDYQPTLKEILQESKKISDAFFEKDILSHIIASPSIS